MATHIDIFNHVQLLMHETVEKFIQILIVGRFRFIEAIEIKCIQLDPKLDWMESKGAKVLFKRNNLMVLN